MSYLLDTNVVSETRRRTPDPNMLAWFDAVDHRDLFVSVLTIGELTMGIERRRHTDPRTADALAHWLNGIETLFADQLVPIDAAIAATWGGLNAARPLPTIDSLLAATAIVKGLTLVTRNVKDVAETGVSILNPWQTGPDT